MAEEYGSKAVWFMAGIAIGAMDGARFPRGKNFPTACMAASAGVRGATVKTIVDLVRAASVETTRAISSSPRLTGSACTCANMDRTPIPVCLLSACRA